MVDCKEVLLLEMELCSLIILHKSGEWTMEVDSKIEKTIQMITIYISPIKLDLEKMEDGDIVESS